MYYTGQHNIMEDPNGSVISYLYEDLKWVDEASHEMLIDWFCCCATGDTWQEKYESSCIRYNGLYWLLWIVTVPCLLSGKWTHDLFGQGDGFEGETKLEREVRIHWLYCTDGPMLAALLIDVYYCGLYVAEGEWGMNNETLVVVLSMTVCIGYVGGNVAFEYAIRNRKPTTVKCMIACNFAFATGLLVALVYGFIIGDVSGASWIRILDYSLRVLVVLFIMLACVIYSPLWSAYDDTDDKGFVNPKNVLPIAAVTCWVYCALIFAFSINFTDLWEALT